jgi:FeS assembly SUF system regulator
VRLSNMADYAVVVMGAAARHCGSAMLVGADGQKRARTSATEIAAETHIALPTVQKLVSILSNGGLLRSVRGAGGGIQLSRPAAAITLADIIEAVEGPIAMTACMNQATCTCTIEPDCNVKPHWAVVNDAVRGALSGVSLSSLAAGR